MRRCAGLSGTGSGHPWRPAMGTGWCFTFIAGVLFFTSPMLWTVTKYGPKWREERRVRIEMHARKQEARQAMKKGGALKKRMLWRAKDKNVSKR